MATIAEPKAPEAVDSGRRLVLNSVSWEAYGKFLEAMGDRPIRTTYDRGTFEIMSPLPRHERSKRRIGRLLEMLTYELGIPIQSAGSTTFRRAAVNRGLEPDECYYLANESRLRGKIDIDFETDPPPDLAIEIDLTHSSVPRMPVYASLGVREVWRFDGASIRSHHLQPDGTYAISESSLNLPQLRPDELLDFLSQADATDETTWLRGSCAWVRAELAPRIAAAGEAGA